MELFIIVVFAIIYIVAKCVSEKEEKKYNSSVKSKTERNNWEQDNFDYQTANKINLRIERDFQYQEQLRNEFNEFIKMIPDMGDNYMSPLSNNKSNSYDKVRVLTMYEMSKMGKFSWIWDGGYLNTYSVLCVFHDRPSDSALTSFFKLYEDRMRKNGMPSLRIVAEVTDKGYPVKLYDSRAWHPKSATRLW